MPLLISQSVLIAVIWDLVDHKVLCPNLHDDFEKALEDDISVAIPSLERPQTQHNADLKGSVFRKETVFGELRISNTAL